MEDGIKYLIGGDNAPLIAALKQAERAMQASGQRGVNIVQKLADKEVAIHKTAVEQRIHALEQEGEANHKLIAEQVADRKAAEALMVKNAEQIEEQIARVRKEHRDKRLAELQQQIDREASAEAAAAHRIAAERERAEVEANERIAQGREALAGTLATVFAGLSLGAGVAIKAFADFEAVMNQMAAVSSLTAKEFEEVKAVALAMGAQTKFSAVEAASGMAELAKAGFTAKESMAAIPGVLSLAAAAGTSVAKSAEIAGGAMQAFGLAADQAGHVADLLAKAANISSVDVTDLGDSFKNVAPLARSAGQSMEEVTTALAVMGDNLIKSGEAGTAMKAALVILLNPSKDAQTAMAKLGLSIQDTAGKMLPLSDIVDQLRVKTAKMTETQRAGTIANIFGADAVAGMLALMNRSLPAYENTAKALNNVTGASEQMAAVMNRGLGASFEQLQGSVDTLFIQFGEQLAPAVKTTAEILMGLANTMVAMDPATKTLITGIAAMAAAFSALTAAAIGVGAALPTIAAGWAAITVAGGPVLWTIGAISLALGGLTAATKLQADAARDAAIKTQEESRERRDAVASALDQKRAIEQLVAEHDRLAGKVRLSKDEQAQLHAIEKRLKEQYPQLAAAVAQAGDSHWGNVPAINAERDALMQLIQARIMDARIAARKARTDYTKSVDAVDQNIRAQGSLQGMSGRGSLARADRFGASMAGQMGGQMERDQQRLIAERSAKAKAMTTADTEVDDLLALVRPVQVGAGRRRGAPISMPAGRGRKSGGKSAAESSADKAIDEIEKRYKRLISESQAAGEAQWKQIELTSAMADEIHAKSLDRFAKGAEVVANARQEIKNFSIAEVVAIKKSVAENNEAEAEKIRRMKQANDQILAEGEKMEREQAESLEKGVEEAAKHHEKVVAKSINSGIDVLSAGVDLQDEAIAAARESLKQLAGDLTGLVLDPTQERFANFFKSLTQDEGKIKGLFKLVGEVKFEMLNAKEGTSGLAAGLGFLTKSIDPVSLALGGIALVLNEVAKGMALAEENAKNYRDTLESIADLEAELDGSKASKVTREIEKINKEEKAAVKPLIDERKRKFAVAEAMALAEGLPAPFTEERKQEIIDSDPLIQAERTKAQRRRDKVFKDVNEEAEQDRFADRESSAEATKASAAAMDAMYGAAGGKYGINGDGPLSEANAANLERLDRFVELTKELTESGRDDYGNRISLQSELDLELAEARGEAEKRVADLQAERLKTQEEIARLTGEELKAIRAIEGESIAVRAETETESKQRRIEEVKNEFAKRRTDLTARESELTNEISNAETEKAKNLSRINILGRERIEQLNAEIAQIVALTDSTERLAALERGRVGGTSSSGAAGGSGGASQSSAARVGETRLNASGDGSKVIWDGRVWTTVKRHSGGPVPGYPGQEVPIIAKAGEQVVTEGDWRSVTRWMAGMRDIGRAGGMPASGGMVNLYGGVHIDAAGGDLSDPLTMQRVAREFGRQIGQGGGRRI